MALIQIAFILMNNIAVIDCAEAAVQCAIVCPLERGL